MTVPTQVTRVRLSNYFDIEAKSEIHVLDVRVMDVKRVVRDAALEYDYIVLDGNSRLHKEVAWRADAKPQQIADALQSLAASLSPMRTDTLDFAGELTQLLNRYSAENESNTPDFLLANHMRECLRAANELITAREDHYGVHCEPGVRWLRALSDEIQQDLAARDEERRQRAAEDDNNV